jgi:diadenosine tetraphosphate (Ap4A) HIT family hydrolase
MHMSEGRTQDTNACLSCDLVKGTKQSLGGTILETELFHAHQDFAYPIPGLVILASKRHFYCMDELSNEEADEFSFLTRRIRRAQRHALGIEHVYYFYNEDTSHHFHLWMVPRYDWMRQFGKSVQAVRPSLIHSRDHMATDENLVEVRKCAAILRNALSPSPIGAE